MLPSSSELWQHHSTITHLSLGIGRRTPRTLVGYSSGYRGFGFIGRLFCLTILSGQHLDHLCSSLFLFRILSCFIVWVRSGNSMVGTNDACQALLSAGRSGSSVSSQSLRKAGSSCFLWDSSSLLTSSLPGPSCRMLTAVKKESGK